MAIGKWLPHSAISQGAGGKQALVEGTVFRDGSSMRINVQMVDPATLRHLWTQTYERDVQDVLAVQNEVVQAIAEELGQALNDLLAQEDR